MKSALAGRAAGWPIRVLVAEDNVVNQKVAVRMLERLGLRADVAANGREAVRMFELLPYDLVFMDCQMPEMDGYEAAQEIRRREGPGRHVAIIAMTADAIEAEFLLELLVSLLAYPTRLDRGGERFHRRRPGGWRDSISVPRRRAARQPARPLRPACAACLCRRCVAALRRRRARAGRRSGLSAGLWFPCARRPAPLFIGERLLCALRRERRAHGVCAAGRAPRSERRVARRAGRPF